jgi:hypothetical protein
MSYSEENGQVDRCPTCGSPKPEQLRARTSTGRWIPWWPSAIAYTCKDEWHHDVACQVEEKNGSG